MNEYEKWTKQTNWIGFFLFYLVFVYLLRANIFQIS